MVVQPPSLFEKIKLTLDPVIGAFPVQQLEEDSENRDLSFLAGESALLWTSTGDLLLAAALACGAVWFTLDTTLLWRDRPYTDGQMRFFLLGWNGAASGASRAACCSA